ncbi:molybdopterin molybdotransferase MoeA [Zooshikella harenae]|uniref:Molybdopterin molybdenumtransferase n=1 Tax=Zooshikella harenae TaxID=2827238 RepID=A0ABS5ZBQ8_9GAMM|nr:gephyrin-like molybdotransferase Glp [Zooshikella harenae]MBU2711491.1 molybdopterin molybdotransferase MoeA [Zooshikella harenae]
MSCCNQPGLIPVDEAVNMLLAAVDTLTDYESVSLLNAINQYLAQPIYAQMDSPAWNNSAMDGYAINFKCFHQDQPFTLVGKAFAGHPYQGTVEPGQCVRIMTGAPIPNGTDTVVMQEKAQEVSPGKVIFSGTVTQGDHIRIQGEDIKQGKLLFPVKHKCAATDIGFMAAQGISTVSVYRRLKIGLISTGDELKPLEATLKMGDIYDSNRYMLLVLLAKIGCDVHDFGIVADDPQLLRDTLIEARDLCDVIITSGGVSVGEADYIKDIISELGELHLWKVAIKPGKPFAYGKLSQTLFLGLPGNPVSALVTFYKLALPAITKMQGGDYQPPMHLLANITHDLRKRPGRAEYIRAHYTTNSVGALMVTSTGLQGSGIMSSLTDANCFIVLDEGQGNVSSGEKVKVEFFQPPLL